MSRLKVVTDSNSGITPEEAARLGVRVLPMPFTINGENYWEDINLTQQQFYDHLTDGVAIHTSQPAVADVLDAWDAVLQEYDEIVHIPMSGSLSSACQTATLLAEDYDGRVQVVDNRRIAVTQRQSVLDALALASAGRSAAEIKQVLEAHSADSSIYIMLDTLQYLKQGGRITPAAAAVTTLLQIKPVLQIQGGKLDAYTVRRGTRQARAALIEAMKKDLATRFAGANTPDVMHLALAYTHDRETAEDFRREAAAAFPGFDLHLAPLSLSVACHIGPGSLAIACSQAVPL